MPFDPNAYLAKKQTAFDPDAYLTSKTKPIEEPGLLSKIGTGIMANMQPERRNVDMENIVPYAPGKAPLTAQIEQAQKKYSPTTEQIGSALEMGAGSLPVPVPGLGMLAKIPERLKESSIGMKLKQAGAIFKDMKKLRPGEPEKLFEVMKKHKIATIGDTFEDVLSKTSDLKDQAGKEIGKIYKNYSDKIASPDFLAGLPSKEHPNVLKKLQSVSLDPEKLAAEIGESVANESKGLAGGREATKTVFNELKNLKDAGIVAKETKTPFMDSLFEYRKSLDDKIKNVYKKMPKDRTPADEALLSVRGKIQQRIDNHLKTLDDIFGTNEVKKLKDANETYKHMTKLSDLSRERVQREAGNRMFGLTELGLGGATFAEEAGRKPENIPEAALKGLGVALLGKAGRKYGPGLLSAGYEKAAQLTSPLRAARNIPAAVPGLLFQQTKEQGK